MVVVRRFVVGVVAVVVVSGCVVVDSVVVVSASVTGCNALREALSKERRGLAVREVFAVPDQSAPYLDGSNDVGVGLVR